MSDDVQKAIDNLTDAVMDIGETLAHSVEAQRTLARIEKQRSAREKRLWYEKEDEAAAAQASDGHPKRLRIVAALERHESFCMDNKAEREALADALAVALAGEGEP